MHDLYRDKNHRGQGSTKPVPGGPQGLGAMTSEPIEPELPKGCLAFGVLIVLFVIIGFAGLCSGGGESDDGPDVDITPAEFVDITPAEFNEICRDTGGRPIIDDRGEEYCDYS